MGDFQADAEGFHEEKQKIANWAAMELKNAVDPTNQGQLKPAWHIRELVCNAAFTAAFGLEMWETAASYNARVVHSKRTRGAPMIEIMRARFNDSNILYIMGCLSNFTRR